MGEQHANGRRVSRHRLVARRSARGLLLGVIPDLVLIPILVVILLISAVKMARHA